jgi:lipopolysaccharide transport system ATP-binding protein
MYVRLAFAVAAHLEPEILLIDEVLAVGDAQFQKKCLGKMEEVSKEGRTVLFVSHNMGTIMQLCDKCILLRKGSVEKMGKPADIIKHYQSAVSNTFFGKDTLANDIYIKKIDTYNESGMTSVFSHSENIRLRIIIGINVLKNYQNIGVVLKTNDKRRVFTVNKSLTHFATEKTREITVDFIIYGGLIAPMYYSFLVSLNTQRGDITYETQDDICPIRVMDDGTEFAFAEGYDYGCIILKDKWELIEKIN